MSSPEPDNRVGRAESDAIKVGMALHTPPGAPSRKCATAHCCCDYIKRCFTYLRSTAAALGSGPIEGADANANAYRLRRYDWTILQPTIPPRLTMEAKGGRVHDATVKLASPPDVPEKGFIDPKI
ncbi:hypothetical protein Z517_09215 [Fonsecaea pedrosoi CBS 271.37]|uniref:Uncharacterized protein n=1 Tax=Fonsecaea pedrosoi CBS 271.37 TaxID=1442368 RepID=A0A0D2DGG2_9EURO|nr:uncharacterized protein Z517_09215 [Fonsecaea pedrosoi CBS 271.37]KIW76771.1 hypothetical protein Z517_09215 [Fonsecaea pedrosoi CBS 271.37]